ncbi:hypothetical protein [Nonomuraea sp. NPDC050783]|uniref:hypothetical protein n=1 Tax=Nonomuraea sp. NPDC050783 TaxID=3154634 RepID=UPI00346777C3
MAAEHAVLDELRQAIDEAFGDRDRVAVREVYARASARVNLPADLLAHLNEVPDEGSYSKEELTEAIDDVIRRRGEQDSLGLLNGPRRAAPVPEASTAEPAAPEPPVMDTPVEETIEAEHAILDDTTLDSLNQPPSGTGPDGTGSDGSDPDGSGSDGSGPDYSDPARSENIFREPGA